MQSVFYEAPKEGFACRPHHYNGDNDDNGDGGGGGGGGGGSDHGDGYGEDGCGL